MIFGPVAKWYAPPVPEADNPPELPLGDEPDSVRAWNMERFEELGIPFLVAYELTLKRADWHAVKRALDGGASVDQVGGIFL